MYSFKQTRTGKFRLWMTAALCVAIFVAMPVVAASDAAPVDNRAVVFISGGEMQGLSFTAELHDNTSYVSVAEFAAAMGATAVMRESNATTVTAPRLDLRVTAGDRYIAVNGSYIYVPSGVRLLGGDVKAPLRPLAEAFGASVMWSEAFRAVFVTRGAAPFNQRQVSNDDLHWMSRIIYAEAGGESFEGKIAVGNVIMNRLHSTLFPDTVYGVIFDRRYGTTQFTPAATGAINNNPSRDCIAAAYIALTDGADIVGESLYFASTTSCWAARNRPCFGGLGNHIFYL